MTTQAVSLEAKAVKLADSIGIPDDRKWVAAGNRLHPAIQIPPGATCREVIHRLASLSDQERAGRLTTALLLRMSQLAQQDRSAIDQALGQFVWQAEQLNRNVFADRFAYVLALAMGADGQLLVQNAWFYGGSDGTPPESIPEIPEEGVSFDTGFDLILKHMIDHEVVNPVIELATPLRSMLDATFDPYYCIVFRWRERAEAKGQFLRLRPVLARLTRVIKARVAEGMKSGWFDSTVTYEELTPRLGADAALPLDFPAFRLGSLTAAEQEARLRYLLLSGVPFAAITRASICKLCAVNEQALIKCVTGQTDFHRLPAHIRAHITGAEDDSIPHLTILWDDFDNNPFLHTYS